MSDTATANPQAPPQRQCDLVMKGGITSGVVYPLAACQLSEDYCFKNIGGTSAGAIAAAATAAAELGRQSATGGFRLLCQLPEFLGAKPNGAANSNLFEFFQPQRATKPVFDILTAGLGGGKWAVARILLAAIKSYWLAFLIGTLPGLAFVWGAMQTTSGLFLGVCVALSVIMLISLGLALVAIRLYSTITRKIPGNFFGLCTGMAGSKNSSGQALTPWLTEYLNQLAGLPVDGPPLTFGDLWGSKDPLADRRINLEMMTTCLSHGRPYRLPFRDDEDVRENRQFFFRRNDFAELFPPKVVDWLKSHPRPPSDADAGTREAAYREQGYYPLPEPWDLPVVVAVRMSLSFPVLLSAVPLYAIDYSRKDETDRVLERCWFSDGGIASNFPVHFFDSLLPRWPTFAINLTEKHPDFPAGVRFPNNNTAGTERWTRFDRDPLDPQKPVPGSDQLFGFFNAIMGAMQNWSDNTQARLPGFRDRIANISLSRWEGGLNLNMDPELIKLLSTRGQAVGMEFAARFTGTDPNCQLNWENHRWVRLRSALASLEENLLALERSCARPCNNDEPYDVWVKTAKNDALPSYHWKPLDQSSDWQRQRQCAVDTLAALRQCAQALQSVNATEPPLANGAPRPRPELRVRPRI